MKDTINIYKSGLDPLAKEQDFMHVFAVRD